MKVSRTIQDVDGDSSGSNVRQGAAIVSAVFFVGVSNV